MRTRGRYLRAPLDLERCSRVLQSCVEQLSGAVSTEEDPPHARGLGGEVAPVRLRHRGVHDGVRVLA